MKIEPVLTREFYHDGRGPCLQRVVWGYKGLNLLGFEYYNPDDVYDAEHLKHILLEGVQAYSMSGEEVHGNILWNGETNAAIVKIVESRWKASFDQTHLSNHEHFQTMFYDQIYDVICRSISAGKGGIPNQTEYQ